MNDLCVLYDLWMCASVGTHVMEVRGQPVELGFLLLIVRLVWQAFSLMAPLTAPRASFKTTCLGLIPRGPNVKSRQHGKPGPVALACALFFCGTGDSASAPTVSYTTSPLQEFYSKTRSC